MSVEPGFGGQKFMPSALDKLRWLKAEREARGAHYLLEADGGVDNATAPQCVEAGADIWWRAVQCSAQQTLLQPCSTSSAFERITIYG